MAIAFTPWPRGAQFQLRLLSSMSKSHTDHRFWSEAIDMLEKSQVEGS